jgi:serine/threonine protein kinase
LHLTLVDVRLRLDLQGKLAIMLTRAVKDYGEVEEGYVTGEISPASVMLTPGDLTYKLSEFTSASSDADAYYAPEQLEAETGPGIDYLIETSNFVIQVDVWGTAATLLHAFSGQPPCKGLSRSDLRQRASEGSAPIVAELMSSSLGEDIKAVLARCFELHPEQRITPAELYTEMVSFLQREGSSVVQEAICKCEAAAQVWLLGQ